MSRKHKQSRPAPVSAEQLVGRIHRAQHEGRFQQALELARQLYKSEPTPHHRELLKEVALGRAQQLRGQGYTRDALTVLEAAVHADESEPAWLEKVAAEMARCGGAAQALALMSRLPEGVQGPVLVQLADASVVQKEGPPAALPESLRADHERIVQAFRHLEAGADDAVRQSLQDISLRSPFLEWKLLVRGLLAYYHNDDPRAIENWQRLNPERLPARLAAPFRFQIDAAYRSAQPPQTQTLLQGQLDRLQGSVLLTKLRALRKTMADRSATANAYRQAEQLLPLLRQEAPQLVPRLARCFYWATIDTGPEDVLRFRRVFGEPPDDPHFNRLQALAHDRAGNLDEAHRFWQLYEMDIAAHPETWPGEQAQRARALVWLHMGHNAATIPDKPPKKARPSFDFFGFADDEPQKPLDPSPAKCFEKSLELAPDQLEPRTALLQYHLDNGRPAQAEKVGRQLLERFPDHLPTLQKLSELYLQRGKPAEALELVQRALQHNPLDRSLRARVSEGHLAVARTHAEADRFAEARQHFQAALDLSTATDNSDLLCCWWACEMRAQDPARAEELLAQARAQAPSALGTSLVMLVECIRLKLDRTLKKQLDDQVKAGLAAPPEPAAVVHLARVVAGLQTQGVSYVGQKTQTSKVMGYINKARKLDFSEKQLEDLCAALWQMKAFVRLGQLSQRGQKDFPDNPLFYLYTALALLGNGRYGSAYRTGFLLAEAQKRVQARPALVEQHDRLRQAVLDQMGDADLFPLGGFSFMENMFERMFDHGPEDEPDDSW